FRAIRYDKLRALEMQDRTYGWTVEMQLKAAKQKFKVKEVPVNYRRRIGVSKISGTVKGTVLAGYKIITTIFKYL
ncbi:MAG: glycosyltransferase family 2 protein, partial [Bacteroidota bacterium]